jgi:hypothetical protein
MPGPAANWTQENASLGSYTASGVTMTFSTGGLTASDVGVPLAGTGIAVGTTVATYISPTKCTVNIAPAASGATSAICRSRVWIEYPDSDLMDGPFYVVGFDGTTGAMTLGSATAAHAHAHGATVMYYGEGVRQLYNQWVRCGVPGTTGVVDLASVAEQGSVPAFTNSPMFFTNNIHSSSPAGYAAMAERFASSFAGV